METRSLHGSAEAKSDSRSVAATVSRNTARRPGQRPAVAARRLSDQPIVAAGSVPGYGPIFNAGVIRHDGNYHLFARAVRDGYHRNRKTGDGKPRFLDYISDLLTFTSKDGLNYRFQKVLHESDRDVVYEDPRVQLIFNGDQPHFLLSYTFAPTRPSSQLWRAALSELTYSDGAFSLDRQLLLGPEQIANKDVVLSNLDDGRIALIQRLEPSAHPKQSIQLATFASLEELWDPRPDFWRRYMETFAEHVILAPGPHAAGVGAGPPPIRVNGDLVFFYHERDNTNAYRTRVALLDGNTARVRATLPDPILVPQLPWERHGDVDDVVFVQGAHLCDNGLIYLTYGAADRHIGAAGVDAKQLLAALHTADAAAERTLRAAA